MDSERFRKIEDIFQSALDLSGAERERFIRESAEGDADLISEVEKLVARYEREETFLESPVWTDSRFLQSKVKREIAESLDDEIKPNGDAKSFVGRRVGVYRLTEEIGRGGMGVVYLGNRADGEFDQKVAVKLVKRGMDTDFILKRFRFERQILANLNHPNIARLLDGGTTQDGSPYFVMEFIEGAPVLKYCDAKKIGLREKLELFGQICSAVAYAHRRKIIHRDIKPGNILVTDDGAPKLLDFGIAKILDPDSINESIVPTATQMRLMTPEYASPEQARGEEVTAASDQYSLGVLLYELITGARPYKFPSRAPHEIARVICEEMPSQPSSGEFGKIITGNAEPAFDADFCKKLDRIVLKALRKNPAERYESVKEFAADIERFLRDENVRAESFAAEKTFAARSAPPQTNTTQKSIAVLPFKNLHTLSEANAGDDEFLSVGLTDALVTRLSNVRQFAVRPTSSVLRFSGADADSFAAGRELNVGFVLDGNILKTENRIRVSVQLLNVSEQTTVWAERFDEDYTDVLSLEDSISKRVAESLVPRLSTVEAKNLAKRATDKPEAYEAYLRGRFHWNSFSEDGFRQAIVYYKRAIEIDPNFALAFAGIADYYIWLGVYGVLPTAEFYPPARDAARRAIALDSQLSEARAALGLARLYGEYDWRESEKDLRRAVDLNPNNAVAHLWFSHILYTQRRFDEGTEHLNRALELDPLSFQNHNTAAWSLYFSRDFERALAKANRLVGQFPVVSHAYHTLGCFLNFVGRTDEAMKAMRRSAKLSNDKDFFNYGIAQTLAAAGKREPVEDLIEKNQAPAGNRRFSEFQIALCYSYLKDKDSAFQYLERAFERRESLLVWLGVEPSFDNLRDDARYQSLLQRMNHPLAASAEVAPNTREQNRSTFSEAATAVQTPESKRRIPARLKYVLGALAAVVFGYGFYHIYSHTKFDFSTTPPEQRWKNNFAATMNLKRLTVSGKARQATVSPDGETVVYISEDAARQSLWLRRIDSEKAQLLVSPDEVYYSEISFSPNGQHVYYRTKRALQRTLHRIAVTGGEPQKVSESVYNSFAFSPDGRRIAYDYQNPDNKQHSLFAAELDENSQIKSAATLFVLDLPNYFPGGISFSPDGKKIVYSRSTIEADKQVINLFVYDFETKTNEKLGARDFNDVRGAAWRKNGEEIVVSAKETDAAPVQLWLVAYPSGDASRLTNDFTNYQGVSLTADSSALVTAKTDTVSNLWTSELSASNQNHESKARRITSGVDRQDGAGGVNWTRDGRILYVAGAGAERFITAADADGANSRRFSTGASNPKLPSLTGDNRFLIYADEKEQKFSIQRFDTETGALVQINSKYAVTPTLAPDNRSIVYATLLNPSSNRLVVRRKPLDGAGEEIALTEALSVRPAVSPDGRFVACNYAGEDTNDVWQIAVLPFDGSAAPRIIKPYSDKFFRSPQERPLAWSPDGKFLYFLNTANNVTNIFRIAATGDAPPVQMTHFASGELFDFALAPDGKSVALARGFVSSDIVIFKNSL